ncbi:MAG: alpha/beta hydrolase, partial [Thermoguttaceae bacterium]|nr:alpha/beta hydrolase [Thermoguttaceae bacterium]
RRREILKQFLESPCIRCQRVVKMIANWRGEVQPHDFPTVQIHGLRDRLLPISLVESPEVLRLDASHLMTLTRPDEVNELLRKLLS